MLIAPLFMHLIVPGFAGEKFELTVGLTRIMFLSPLFLGLSSVLGGVLQSFKRFFVYSLAPIFYNIGIILGALFLVPKLGIYGLAWGVVGGAMMHMLVQLPTVFSLGFRYRLIFNLYDKNIRKIAVMMLPRTMSLAISQINLVVITIIASTLASGSLTVFNFANNLQAFPIGIFGISFAVAAFPTLSSVAFFRKKIVQNFSSTIRQILFFIVPSTVLLLTLRAQIIRVIYGTGNFNWEDTVMTIDTLGFFSISLFAQACLPLLVRMFYARHNSKTPFIVGLVSVGVNIALSLILPKIVTCREVMNSAGDVYNHCAPMGVTGLALAFSLANIINFALLWVMLRIELGYMEEKRILISTVKFSVAALAAGIAVQGTKLVVWPYVDMTRFWGVFTQGLLAGISGILVYLAFCSLFKSEELFHFWSAIKRRLPFKKVETEDQGEARGI
jgi:putative peptidoglycan lipid II flippase